MAKISAAGRDGSKSNLRPRAAGDWIDSRIAGKAKPAERRACTPRLIGSALLGKGFRRLISRSATT